MHLYMASNLLFKSQEYEGSMYTKIIKKFSSIPEKVTQARQSLEIFQPVPGEGGPHVNPTTIWPENRKKALQDHLNQGLQQLRAQQSGKCLEGSFFHQKLVQLLLIIESSLKKQPGWRGRVVERHR